MSNELFSDIKVFPVKAGTSKLRANGQVTICGTIRVNFRVMEGSKGLFATFPSEKGKDKEGKDTYFPLMRIPDKDTNEQFNQAILAAYNEAVGGGTTQQESTPTKPKAKVPF